jgi:general secretion pathway protein G
MLMAVAIPGYSSYIDRTKVSAAIADVAVISLSVDKFKLAYDGELPESLDDIDQAWRQDPWGRAYEYLVLEGANGNGDSRKDKSLNPLNTDFDLYSKGKDGETISSLVPKVSHDDVIRAANGSFVGLAEDF